jgi:hypothetical protein
MNYDSENKAAVFGFGAKLKFPNLPNDTSQCFPCSGDWDNYNGIGVEGIFYLYNLALMNLNLSGPTYFGEII